VRRTDEVSSTCAWYDLEPGLPGQSRRTLVEMTISSRGVPRILNARPHSSSDLPAAYVSALLEVGSTPGVSDVDHRASGCSESVAR
jgi:hypothetical protein